jgi:NMD protein affecting ribosome stability and mRNA decay
MKTRELKKMKKQKMVYCERCGISVNPKGKYTDEFETGKYLCGDCVTENMADSNFERPVIIKK